MQRAACFPLRLLDRCLRILRLYCAIQAGTTYLDMRRMLHVCVVVALMAYRMMRLEVLELKIARKMRNASSGMNSLREVRPRNP